MPSKAVFWPPGFHVLLLWPEQVDRFVGKYLKHLLTKLSLFLHSFHGVIPSKVSKRVKADQVPIPAPEI
jgi:hypothetical protein